MENGVQVFEGTPIQEVKVDDGEVPGVKVEETKAVGDHGSKNLEGPLDERNDGLRLESHDDDDSVVANEESAADISVAKRCSSMLDDVEITENPVEGSNGVQDDEGESTVIKGESSEANGNEGFVTIVDDNDSVTKEELSTADEKVVGLDSGPSVIEDEVEKKSQDISVVERSSRMLDDVQVTEYPVEGSNGAQNNGENTEMKGESFEANGHEGFVTVVDDNDDVTKEELSTVDERVVGLDSGPSSVIEDEVEKPSQNEVSEFAPSKEEVEVAPVNVKEIEAIDSDNDTVEKSVVTESSDSKDVGTNVQDAAGGNLAEEIKGDGTIDRDAADGSLAEEVKDIITNGNVDHVHEMVRELENDSVAIYPESGKDKLEEIKETVSGNVNNDVHHDSETVSSSVSQPFEEIAEVVPEKVMDDINSEIHDSNNDPGSQVLPVEHQNGGPKAEVGSLDTSSSVYGGEKVMGEANLEIDDGHNNPGIRVLDVEHQNGGSKTEVGLLDSSSSVDLEPKKSTPLIASSLDNVKPQNVPSDLGTPTNATNKTQSPDIVAGGSHASDRKKAQADKDFNQARRESIVKPPQISSGASGKSSNSVVPPAQPAGLGRAAPLLEPAPRVANQPRANGQVPQTQTNVVEDTTNGEAEEGDEIREKLQMIRVKFLRLAHRLGQTPHNVVVAQVLYRLGLAEQLRARNGGRVGAFSFDRASAMAEQLEAVGQEPLDFSCTIMVLGKAGVGKSATINSIFDEVKFSTDAFQMGTKKVQDVVGTVQGIKVRVIDTPGLLTSCADQHKNVNILHSVKRFIKKSSPDIVLYLDRLDMPSRDFGDMPLLRTMTEIFGPSIWFNAIVVLTHAASAPPEGPDGTPSTYDMFVTQRSHAVQQVIRQAAGDMRLMNPVSLVENHSACRTNRAGQRVLPNGQVWKPHLLLLSFASKILAEANILLKLQDSPPEKPFTSRIRAPPLPYLLSSLLQSRPQLKLPEEQYGDDDAMDDDLDETSDSDEESAYDELPPFKPLTKAQLAKLPKAQKKAYYEELEYREKLFMKKQLKEEKIRRKMMKKMDAAAKDTIPSEYNENVEEESGGAASLPVPMADLALPASFDSDNPTHRYRYLDTSNQWLVRPVLDNHGWDHDVGYEGINIERMFAVKDKTPLSLSAQISKDKKEANLQMEVAGSVKHGEGKATTMGFDVQSVGKDMTYTLRSETRFSNYRRNKATAGLSATLIGDVLSMGLKVEDKFIINRQMRVVMSGGAMAGRGEVAYGGSLEAAFRDKDYPVGRFLSTIGLSVMDWHGELTLGCNVQSNIPMGRSTNLVARANLNNRGSGQVSLRLNSADQLQLALIAFLPLLRKIMAQPQERPFGF